MADRPPVVIEPLSARHDRLSFACGAPVLDDYLRKQASQDVRRNIARVFVAVDPTSAVLAGYYTLSASSIARERLPEHLAKRLPRHPIPAAILGRLAVDRAFQGRGIGGTMLADAVIRLIHARDTLAIYALIVDAKGEAARRYYEGFGFIAFPGLPDRLFLPFRGSEKWLSD